MVANGVRANGVSIAIVSGRHHGDEEDQFGKVARHRLRCAPRLLQVQLDDGSTLQYSGVGEGIWQRLSSSGAAWSFYRDNIEEEFTKLMGSASQLF